MKQKPRAGRADTPHTNASKMRWCTLDWTTLAVTLLDRNTPVHTSLQTQRAKAMLHWGADGCHVNMPGRLGGGGVGGAGVGGGGWVITSRMSARGVEVKE